MEGKAGEGRRSGPAKALLPQPFRYSGLPIPGPCCAAGPSPWIKLLPQGKLHLLCHQIQEARRHYKRPPAFRSQSAPAHCKLGVHGHGNALSKQKIAEQRIGQQHIHRAGAADQPGCSLCRWQVGKRNFRKFGCSQISNSAAKGSRGHFITQVGKNDLFAAFGRGTECWHEQSAVLSGYWPATRHIHTNRRQ